MLYCPYFHLQLLKLPWWWSMALEEGWACGSGTWMRWAGHGPSTPLTSWALAGVLGLLSPQILKRQRSSLYTLLNSGDSRWAWRKWFCSGTVWGDTWLHPTPSSTLLGNYAEMNYGLKEPVNQGLLPGAYLELTAEEFPGFASSQKKPLK